MKYDTFYETDGHTEQEYERSHGPRLDFLVEDLKLNELHGKLVVDIGCGPGFIYKRLSPEIQTNYVGVDGADIKDTPFTYVKADLDTDFAAVEQMFDVALCFETLEHLTNPYQCLCSIKKLLKPDGVLYLTIPHEWTNHNTIYPGLMYPVENFVEFLQQMAFEIKGHALHDKSFYQEVFTLVNKPWSNSKMKWHRQEDKFRNIPPHVSVNL